MPTITTSYMEALGKQIFAKDYILNGLFPCQSSIVRMINLSRVDWKFNDKFEYRMLMSNSNSGGTINTQTFDPNFRLLHKGQLEYMIFQASYGALMDGFDIDMMKQLETREARASFNREYAMRLHSMRLNVASMFKNYVINGRYGVMHRIMGPLFKKGATSTDDVKYKIMVCSSNGYANIDPITGVANGPWKYVDFTGTDTGTPGSYTGYTVGGPPSSPTVGSSRTGTYNMQLQTGDHIRIETPRNVYASNFKNGRLISRSSIQHKIVNGAYDNADITKASLDAGNCIAPWGKSLVDECYVVFDNQPKMLELVYIGSAGVASWNVGDFLELAANRKCDLLAQNGNMGKMLTSAKAGSGIYTANSTDGLVAFWKWNAGPIVDKATEYTEETGATEGLADLFPWYTKVGMFDQSSATRLGIDRVFRGQKDRLRYTTEQAGSMILQQKDQSIMEAIFEGVDLAQSVTDWEDLVVWINPVTLAAISEYEGTFGVNGGGLQVFKEASVDSKLIYQRGITGISYKIGEKVIPNVVKDYNLPTDVILIAPLKDIQYNCWDNAAFELNQYIQDTWSGKKPPEPKDVAVPKEFATKLDLSSRIIYGTPVSADLTSFGYANIANNYNGFIHPSNSIPVAYQEMGTLFTENPYAYTIVKLRNQIITPSDTIYDNW